MTSLRRTAPLFLLVALALGAWLLLRDGGSPAAPVVREPDAATETGADDGPTTRPGDADRREAFATQRAETAPAKPQSATGAELAGIVVRPDGRPVEGVRVSAIGDERRETTSDARGRFSFGAVERMQELLAEKDGWVLIAKPRMHGDPRTGWQPLEFVVTPTAELAVNVVDEAGMPVAGARVLVDVSPTEPFGRQESGYREFQPSRFEAASNELGAARFAGVAAECVLRVHVGGERFEHVAGGVLCERRPRAAPLVLGPGEERTVRARLGTRVALAGRVFEPEGRPSSRAYVHVFALDHQDQGRPAHVASPRTEDDGRFAIDAVATGRTRRLLVVARSSVGEEPSYSMFGGPEPPDPIAAAWAEVLLDERGRADDEVLLRVAPLPAIAGRVVDEDRPVAPAEVEIEPLGPRYFPDVLVSRRRSKVRVDEEGRFRLTGVPHGEYRVVARAIERAPAVAEPVLAGTEDLVLELGEEDPARVTVEVESDLELSQIILLHARLDPLPGVGDDAPVLPAESDVREPFGWPTPALGLWYGGQSYRGPLGNAEFASGPIRGTSRTYAVDAGLHWFGAKARTPDGTQCFPVGTGLVRVGPGEHVVRIRLVGSGSLEGVVRGARPDLGLCVALATRGGRLVPLEARREELQRLTGLSAGGRFRFPRAPAGEFRVVVGTHRELESGRWTAQAMVRIETGGEHVVELSL